MTPSELHPLIASLALLIGIANAVYMWMTAGTRANANQLEELSKRMNQVERRVDKAETEIRNMPDRDMVHRMELTLTEMRGEIGVLSQRLVPVAAISERLQEFLLEQNREHNRK